VTAKSPAEIDMSVLGAGDAHVVRVRQRRDNELVGGYTVVLIKPR
jgi:hypothetical protein